ncbi:hypothetical protein ABMA79_07400 [Halobacteriovorax sp. HFRX-2_2]|uniref:hypothetical protein n=1 Tax=unclassified Halobacteriovorax TaxID=2639665 RepID=UPI003711AC98
MRSIFLIPMILLLSCGKPNERAFFGQNLNPSFKGQSLIATQIQCQSIQTNFSSEEISCPTSFINEDKLFLFSVNQEDIDLSTVNGLSLITLRVSTNTDLQARFYLVSKYGKRLSETVFFDGKSDLSFKEKNVGDFFAHEVYLKLEDYYIGGVKPISVRDEDDQNCDTGLFNVEDVNLEDLRGQCPNLKVISNLKARVQAPVYQENDDFDMTGVNPIHVSFGKYGSADYRINYRVFKYMQEREVDYERFYEVETNEFGFKAALVSRELCEIEGVLDIESSSLIGGWIRIKEDQVSNLKIKNVVILGKSYPFYGNYKRKKCYPVDPKLSGTILIKE